MRLVDDLQLGVYADSRPRNLEIARLQKGLVLSLNGSELIEEGIGFGVPVVIYEDKTYFSGSASVTIEEKRQDWLVSKRFYMDTVSKKGWKDGVFVDAGLYKIVTDSLAKTYRNYPASRSVILPLIKWRTRLGIRTLFTRVEPRGSVLVNYSIRHNSVRIRADFSPLNKSRCKRVLLLNEQGAGFFGRFFDSEGLDLKDGEIGPWDPVSADWACFSNIDKVVRFCVRNRLNSMLFRGREQIKERLGWAGMGYELTPSMNHFDYTVRVHGERNEVL